jgi:glycosyltransferase involved in cell wall biosynthesis
VKIAVYHNLPSGGGKRALFEMVKHLAGSHELEVFTTSSAEHDFCDLRPYVTKHDAYNFESSTLLKSPLGRVNPALRTMDLFRLDALQRQIAKAIDEQNYDLVFIHNCRFSQAPGIIRYLKTKSIYYCGEPPRGFTEPQVDRPYFHRSSIQRILDSLDPLPGFYRRTLLHIDRTSALTATKVLVNSAYSREAFFRVYGRFVSICYLGVDCEKFHPLGLERQHFVCSVGALRPNKGFGFLIESLALIPSEQRPALLIVCNEVILEEKTYLEKLAHQSGVMLEIRAMITDVELVKLYNQALLTLYAPVMEPFGFVPLESMACGTPVIGVNEAGVRETVIDKVTGLLVEREPIAMSRAIQDLLSSTNRLEALGATSRVYALEHWSWESCTLHLDEIINQVIKTHSNPDNEQ